MFNPQTIIEKHNHTIDLEIEEALNPKKK